MKWGIQEFDLTDRHMYKIEAIQPLKQNRSNARETPTVGAVPTNVVEATLEHMHDKWASMVRVLLLTGARPEEICTMRAADLDMSGPIWLYKPMRHKTEHHGVSRVIPIGPKDQAVIQDRLPLSLTDYIWPGRFHKSGKSEHAATNGLYQAVRRAVDKAKVMHWYSYQLRHTYATEAKRLGYQMSNIQEVLGHTDQRTTETYIDTLPQLAVELAGKIGWGSASP